MYQVYTLSDPRDTSIRYVGIGQNAYKRYATHILNPGKTTTNKDVWVQELLASGSAPLLNIIETVETKQQAEDREHYWIRHYLDLGSPLVNMSKINHAYIMATRRNMNLETAKQIISDQGWSPTERARRNGTRYLYAQRRNRLVERHLEERYIAPLSRLEEMSKEEILAKLTATISR